MTRSGKSPVSLAQAAPSPAVRELLTIDLCGLKSMLMTHCERCGRPASAVVRDALQRHLMSGPGGLGELGVESPIHRLGAYLGTEGQARTRVSFRLTLADADELQRHAQTAGLSLAAWVLHVMRHGQKPDSAQQRSERIAALTQSNAELATLARSIGHLTALLRQGEVRAAQEYRHMLDMVAVDVRAHLKLVAQLLAADRSRTGCSNPFSGETDG